MAKGNLIGLECICESCEKHFLLTTEDDVRHPTPSDEMQLPATYVKICSCESGGVYDSYVDCPHCKQRHNLY